MANKSSKSPTGESRESSDTHLEPQEIQKEDIQQHTQPAPAGPSRKGKQENLKNRGFEEDHPKNPVRSTGSTDKHQETLPTGEPDPGEAKLSESAKKTGESDDQRTSTSGKDPENRSAGDKPLPPSNQTGPGLG